MTVAEKVVEKLNSLPPEKQQEVLDFVESLSAEHSPERLIDPKGLWAGRGCDISQEELAEARREMWSKFYDEDTH
jgi:hypothetical protein